MELPLDDDAPLLPSEVAALFSVNRQTVDQWVSEGKLPAVGPRRYRAGDVRRLVAEGESLASPAADA
jgi:hypothetical protein